MNGTVAYVAGPYNGDVDGNIKRAEEVSIELIKKGYSVITPQKNTAHYEKYEGEDLNLNTWMEMDFNLIERCDVVFIMENWEGSIGVTQEIHFAKKHGIPVIFLSETIMRLL
jgi:nucleoside 2-deoxyribosyltransferase